MALARQNFMTASPAGQNSGSLLRESGGVVQATMALNSSIGTRAVMRYGGHHKFSFGLDAGS
jgi:hypothetical protein